MPSNSKRTPHVRKDAGAREEKLHVQEVKAASRKHKGVALAANKGTACMWEVVLPHAYTSHEEAPLSIQAN